MFNREMHITNDIIKAKILFAFFHNIASFNLK